MRRWRSALAADSSDFKFETEWLNIIISRPLAYPCNPYRLACLLETLQDMHIISRLHQDM